MKAKLLPLDVKYYGTRIVVGDGVIEIWGCGKDSTPSVRELAGICTPQEYRDNVWLPDKTDGWSDKKGVHVKTYMDICDSHYETQGDYEIALAIVAALKAVTISPAPGGEKEG